MKESLAESPLENTAGWWSRERTLVLVLAAATLLAFYLCYLLLRPFLPALAWALALAVVAHPMHDWIARHVAFPNLAAGIAVAIVAITIVTPAFFVTQRLVAEAGQAIDRLASPASAEKLQRALKTHPRIASIVEEIQNDLEKDTTLQRAATFATHLSSLVKGSVRGTVELMAIFFFLFFFFRDRRATLDTLRSLLPLSNVEADQVFKRVEDTLYATIYGTLVVAMVQGALGGLMFWWLGLPTPLVWGTVMGLLAIVPVLGAFVIWIPASVYLVLAGNWGKAVILALWGSVVISLIDNLLYPILVGKRLRLHTVPVFIAIVGGLLLFGASGLILGPVVLGVTVALVDVWRRRTLFGQSAEAAVKKEPMRIIQI